MAEQKGTTWLLFRDTSAGIGRGFPVKVKELPTDRQDTGYDPIDPTFIFQPGPSFRSALNSACHVVREWLEAAPQKAIPPCRVRIYNEKWPENAQGTSAGLAFALAWAREHKANHEKISVAGNVAATGIIVDSSGTLKEVKGINDKLQYCLDNSHSLHKVYYPEKNKTAKTPDYKINPDILDAISNHPSIQFKAVSTVSEALDDLFPNHLPKKSKSFLTNRIAGIHSQSLVAKWIIATCLVLSLFLGGYFVFNRLEKSPTLAVATLPNESTGSLSSGPEQGDASPDLAGRDKGGQRVVDEKSAATANPKILEPLPDVIPSSPSAAPKAHAHPGIWGATDRSCMVADALHQRLKKSFGANNGYAPFRGEILVKPAGGEDLVEIELSSFWLIRPNGTSQRLGKIITPDMDINSAPAYLERKIVEAVERLPAE